MLVETRIREHAARIYNVSWRHQSDGKLTTLMEAQNTGMTNWNDLPVKNYDFQGRSASLARFVRSISLTARPSFPAGFGSGLAGMPASMPDGAQKNRKTARPCAGPCARRQERLCIREQLRTVAFESAKPGVQFDLQLPTEVALSG